MTRSVLIARLHAAGFDPALFTGAELDLIASAIAAPPPFPALPCLHIPPLPPTEPLFAAIRAAARDCLAALGTDSLHFAFDSREHREALLTAAAAIGSALPAWQAQATDWLEAAELSCAEASASLEAARGALRELICLHTAACLRQDAFAKGQLAVMDAYHTQIAAAETALVDADTAMQAFSALFDDYIPALFDAAAPLFGADARPFSPADFRRAAQALREAAQS